MKQTVVVSKFFEVFGTMVVVVSLCHHVIFSIYLARGLNWTIPLCVLPFKPHQ